MNHMSEGTRLLDPRWSGTLSTGFHLLGAFLGSVPNSLERFHEMGNVVGSLLKESGFRR